MFCFQYVEQKHMEKCLNKMWKSRARSGHAEGDSGYFRHVLQLVTSQEHILQNLLLEDSMEYFLLYV